MTPGNLMCCALLLLAAVTIAAGKATEDDADHRHEAVAAAHHDLHSDEEIGPEIGIVGNFLTELTDNRSNPNRGKFRAREVELAFQAFLLPGTRANVVAAFEQEYEHNHAVNEYHIEEAYLAFMELPWGADLILGRTFVGFGIANAIHPHRRLYADTPLVLANFLGEHNWYDDGLYLSAPVTTLYDIPIRAGFGYFKGRNNSHAHADDHEEEHAEGPVEWDGPVSLARVSSLIGLDDVSRLDVGYSLASDSGRDTMLHGIDLTYVRKLPGDHRTITWQNELLLADVKESDSESMGFYSLVNLSLDENWEIGGRYDWSQMPADDKNHEWALSPFVTYHFTESMYGRLQYRYRDMIEDEGRENALFLQFVVELGSHSHRDH